MAPAHRSWVVRLCFAETMHSAAMNAGTMNAVLAHVACRQRSRSRVVGTCAPFYGASTTPLHAASARSRAVPVPLSASRCSDACTALTSPVSARSCVCVEASGLYPDCRLAAGAPLSRHIRHAGVSCIVSHRRPRILCRPMSCGRVAPAPCLWLWLTELAALHTYADACHCTLCRLPPSSRAAVPFWAESAAQQRLRRWAHCLWWLRAVLLLKWCPPPGSG
jgi:hypothetical protein